MDEFLRIGPAATKAGCAYQSIVNWIDQGKLDKYTDDGEVVVSVVQIEELLKLKKVHGRKWFDFASWNEKKAESTSEVEDITSEDDEDEAEEAPVVSLAQKIVEYAKLKHKKGDNKTALELQGILIGHLDWSEVI